MTVPSPDDDQSTGPNPYPVDSTTRACCGGIGAHTDQCPEQPTNQPRSSAPELVDLDPPAPLPAALARWQELAKRDLIVDHDDDATKVMPVPRPAWADPDEDHIDNSQGGSYYRSSWVNVASLSSGGKNLNGVLYPANCSVSAKLHGNNSAPLIGLVIRRVINGKWHEHNMSLPLQAAVDLAHVLLTAVDMVGGVPEVDH
ncbi:hypothetical protein [Mycobacterium canetti]|uniref:hypothetical protein n=1 Tax=Mycobacterium canetti TaxID=78331 RepID=UPI001E38C7BC|nr:hypothetical protein [Mycobacterium canetti]